MKDKIIVYTFLIYILIFSISHIVIKDNEISSSERRHLKTFPKYELSSNYITSLDNYLLDHFPLREEFRSIKAKFNYNILQKSDNNNIYIKDNYIFKSNYPTSKDSVENFIKNINKLKKTFNNNKVYLLTIPDKNFYLKDKTFLHIDYDYIYNELNKLNIINIDIRKIMNLEDYYKTDTHWKQEKLDKVVKELSKTMNFDYQQYNYTSKKYDKFYGVYYGESAIKQEPETITYLTNNIIEQSKVFYLENSQLNKVYNKDKLLSLYSYAIYLDGASAYIEIENTLSNNSNELIIFRDSFGSSLIPLLIPYYKKITVIDNRYIDSNNFLQYIEFNNQDILFIYSTLLINNSFSLKG